MDVRTWHIAAPDVCDGTRPQLGLDAAYPASTAIKLILDNHSAHISRETRAWLDARPPGRFEFTFTPKHGSWLNLIEGSARKAAGTRSAFPWFESYQAASASLYDQVWMTGWRFTSSMPAIMRSLSNEASEQVLSLASRASLLLSVTMRPGELLNDRLHFSLLATCYDRGAAEPAQSRRGLRCTLSYHETRRSLSPHSTSERSTSLSTGGAGSAGGSGAAGGSAAASAGAPCWSGEAGSVGSISVIRASGGKRPV